MKQKVIQPIIVKKKTLVHKKTDHNLLTKTLVLQREARAAYLIQDGLATYTGLIIDIVISSIEELFKLYNDTPMVEHDARLKEYLDECHKAATDSYEFFSGIAKDKQFFCDLRDGAQEYFTPIFNDVFEGFKVIYKCTGVKHYKLSAMTSLIWSMIELGRISAEGLHAAIAKASKCTFSGEGMNQYKLVNIRERFVPIMDNYVPRFPDVLQPSIDKLLEKLADAIKQDRFVVAAGRYAVKYNPSYHEYMVNICRNCYGVKFTKG